MDYVIHLTSCAGRTTLASAKIARWLSGQLGAELVDRRVRSVPRSTRRVFFVNSPVAFCSFRDQLAGWARSADEVVWVQNDYAIKAPRSVRGLVTRLWTTIPDLATGARDAYINWNQLTYSPVELARPSARGLFYYGAFRAGRVRYFKKYLCTDRYPVSVSTTRKAARKFAELAPSARLLPPFTSASYLSNFEATIYVEDRYSHEHYCSPANRFYEALGSGLAMLVDEGAAPSLARAGFDIEGFVVSSASELAERLKSAREIQQRQATLWRGDYVGRLAAEVAQAASAL